MRKTLIMGVAVVAVLLMASLAMAAGYSDVPATSIYAPAVNALTNAKVMTGVNGMFNGTATVNRYQLAQTVYNLLNYVEQDPSLASAQDVTVLQTIVNSIVKKLGDNNSIVANLQSEFNSLKVVVDQLKSVPDVSKIVANNSDTLDNLQSVVVSMKTDLSNQIDSVSSQAEKALKMTNINNTMIAMQAKKIAADEQDAKTLTANVASLKADLTKMVNDNGTFLYKKIDLVNQSVTENASSIKALKAQLDSLNSTVSDNYVALSTSITSVKGYLSNQINFVRNDLSNTKSQLSNELSNTKVALEQEVKDATNKANLAMWTGVAGIAVGAIGLGTFLYWVWNYFPQY